AAATARESGWSAAAPALVPEAAPAPAAVRAPALAVGDAEWSSLHGHTFGEIPRLIHVAAAPDGDVVGQQLQRQDHEDGPQQLRCTRDLENHVARRIEHRQQTLLAASSRERDDRPA